MCSRSIGIYAVTALASVVVYVIFAFARGTGPETQHEWVVFFLTGSAIAVVASAIIGSLVAVRGRRNSQTTELE